MVFGFFKNTSVDKDFSALHEDFLHDAYSDAEKKAHDLLEKKPHHIKTQMLIAQMARNEQHYKKSRERYNKVVSYDKTNKEALLGRARSSYQLYHFEEALADYITLYESSFSSSEYLVALAETYQKLNLQTVALTYYEKAVIQSPKNIRAHVGLGYQYVIMGHYKQAREQAETAKDLYYKHKYEYDTNVVDNIFGLEEQVSLLTKEPVKKGGKKKSSKKIKA